MTQAAFGHSLALLLLAAVPTVAAAQSALGQQPREWEFVLSNAITTMYIDRSSIVQRFGQTRVLVMSDHKQEIGGTRSSFVEWIFKCNAAKPQYRMSYIETFSGNRLTGSLTQGGRVDGESWVDIESGEHLEKMRAAVCT